jgi:putative glycosyltransferase
VVYGVQDRRKGGLVERVTGRLFYRLFDWLAPFPMPGNLSTARLMTRRYVRSLVAHRERETMIAGLWAITGYHQVPLAVQKQSHGGSTYDLRRKLAILLNAVTSFSDRPVVIVFCLGLAIALLAGLAAAGLVARWLLFGAPLAGWPSLVVSIWLLGGLTLLSIGVVGLYVARILVEAKRRPYAIVRQVYDASGRHP